MSSQKSPRQRALVIGLIILGILFSFFFGMRAFHAYRKFTGRRPPPPGKVETDVELIRNWMTIPFIAQLYRVREETVFDALKIPQQGNREKSLKELNREYYPGADGFVLNTIKTTISAHQPPPIHGSATATIPPPTALTP